MYRVALYEAVEVLVGYETLKMGGTSGKFDTSDDIGRGENTPVPPPLYYVENCRKLWLMAGRTGRYDPLHLAFEGCTPHMPDRASQTGAHPMLI